MNQVRQSFPVPESCVPLALALCLLVQNSLHAQYPALDDFNSGLDGNVTSVAMQADGRILVCGWFGPDWRMRTCRLNSDGTVDSTFYTDNPFSTDDYGHLKVEEDGMILNGIVRLNPNGSPDSSVRPATFNRVACLAVQADRKIILAGVITGQARDSVVRVNPDGTLDNTFHPAATDNSVYTVALQVDGKILVGGYFTSLNGQPRNAIARLNPDGTLDSAFNAEAGGDPDDPEYEGPTVYSLAVQGNGGVLVGGYFYTLNGQRRPNLGRLNADGTLDEAFNPATGCRDFDWMTLQVDGKIFLGSCWTYDGGQPRWSFRRLNADGTLDNSFNPIVPIAGSGWPTLQADGKILVGASCRLNNTEAATQTLDYDGTTITWLRSGTGPEVWRTTFEHSTDGLTWTNLGAGVHIPGGWRMSGVSLPQTGTLRARGHVTGGYFNASSWFVEGYHGNPVLVCHPASRINNAGTTARFRVVAGGSGPWHVQWYKDGVPWVDQRNAVDGANSATLTLGQVSKADEGGYTAVLSNHLGSVTSQVARLTVIDPFITAHPANTNRNQGESVTLQATAAGAQPMSYQWYRDGVAMPGAVLSYLSFPHLTPADIGLYSMMAANAHGSVTSAPALLTVNAATPDDTFNPRANNTVYALAVQPDGKILTGNRSDWVHYNNLARLNADGTLDSAFSLKPEGEVACLAIQADGNILVGGHFTSLGGQKRYSIARLNPDGALDSTFNPTNFGIYVEVYSLVVQADGKILAGGLFDTPGRQSPKNIARLNADGTLDNTFNPVASWKVISMMVQADGKIVVAGELTALNGQPRNHIGRLNADGTLDGTFNPDANGVVHCLAMQADGKILVGGDFTTLIGQPRNRIGRLNSDGTLDATFNPGANSAVYSMVVQTDGRILVEGLRRLNADGTLDLTFNPAANSTVFCQTVQADGKILAGGWFSTPGSQPRRLNNTDPATQFLSYDGTAVTWLRGGSSPEVSRTTFEHSDDGLVWTYLGAGTRIGGGWQLAGISLPPVGILRARGYVEGGRSSWFVEGYHGGPVILTQPASCTNGAGTTASFRVVAGGSGPWQVQWFKYGELLVDQGNALDAANTATLTLRQVLKADEGIYWAVLNNGLGNVTSAEVTLTVLDPFITAHPVSANRNIGESVTLNLVAAGTPPMNYQWYHDGVAVQGAVEASLTLQNLSKADAGVYTALVGSEPGSASTSPALLTVNAATLDTTFHPEIKGSVSTLAFQVDGKMLVGGSFTMLCGQPRLCLARLNADGTLDNTFNPGTGGEFPTVHCLTVQPDGKILVGGEFTVLGGKPRGLMGRLHADGTLDDTFNPEVTNGDSDCYPSVESIVVQTDGKILVGGAFETLGRQNRSCIGRLHADGTLDSTFNAGWVDKMVNSMVVQADGKILAGGLFTRMGGMTSYHIGRLNPDGTLDNTYNASASGDACACHDQIYTLVLQADGKVLVGGDFTTLNGQPRNRIGRLNPNGTLDFTFNPGANGNVSFMAAQTDGKILVGGWFNILGGQPRNSIGRLNADGSVDNFFNPLMPASSSFLALQGDGRILMGGADTILRLNNSDPASQSLRYESNTITWLRGGTSPEVWRTTFEHSEDGLVWTHLGAGTRSSGEWRLTGVSPPGTGTLRARGHVAGGRFDGSGWFLETTLSAPSPVRLRMVREGSTAVLSWTGRPGPYQVQQTTDLSQPDAWQNVGEPVQTNSIQLPIGPGSVFLRVRAQ